MPHFPPWLHLLAIASLGVSFACAAVIVWDETRHPQKMWIMNLVWPLTALFGGLLWLAGCWVWGRRKAKGVDAPAGMPFPVMVAKGSSHCGAGCTLGDIVAERLAFAVPAVAVRFGCRWLFSEKIFAVWVLDHLIAFAIGVVFQFFTIRRMRDLSVGQGIVAAVKADAASITAWQVGMYGLMGLIQFGWFARAYGGTAPVDSVEFWFAMQIAMLAGFVASCPVNALLIRVGLKEKM